MITTEEEKIEITQEQINEWVPFFALPCYDRQVTEPFFMSFIKTALYLKEIGMKFSMATVTDSLISRARNTLVAKFMANPVHTHMLFIDVDLGFEPEAILKLLWQDKDIVTAAYPIKEINWKKVADFAKQGIDPSKLAGKSTRFVVNPVKPGNNSVKTDKGALAIYDAGTGFMLIKREAIQKMMDAHPELKYNDDTGSLNDEEKKYTYALFNSYVDDEQKRFLSEDYGFARYWQNMGNLIWVDPSIELTHLGRFNFTGNMIEYLIDLDEKDTKSKNKSKKPKKV